MMEVSGTIENIKRFCSKWGHVEEARVKISTQSHGFITVIVSEEKYKKVRRLLQCKYSISVKGRFSSVLGYHTIKAQEIKRLP